MPPNRHLMNDEQRESEFLEDCSTIKASPVAKSTFATAVEGEETEEQYRRRVYETADKHAGLPPLSQRRSNKVVRKLSKVLRRQSSIKEALPETPQGWIVFLSSIASLVIGYEVKLQQSLTQPPRVYGQLSPGTGIHSIYQKLTATPQSILRRTIQPSLFVGTRSVVSSTAAYAGRGPSDQSGVLQFREVITNAQDGGKVALDWELPPCLHPQQSQRHALQGPIVKPVVLILHGINNDASFGYIRAAMRCCTKRGWWAIGVNFRGCGGVALTTPRGYTGAYTGDLRNVVWRIVGRMTDEAKLFVVGNSLGANLITKYLGEEGLNGTLPKQVAGGVSLANPMHIHSRNIAFPWGHILSLGARKGILENWATFHKMKSEHYQACIRSALMAPTIADFDEALAPIFIRNSSFAPYENKIGYKNAEQYWDDASSYKHVSHISVPLLQLTSEDDFLVRGSSGKLSYSLANPNVMVVNTRCGGHLGWHECPPDTNSMFGFGTSWADTATADFIAAILEGKADMQQDALKSKAEGEAAEIRSRL